MKKFVAIVMVLSMMVCGSAFAASVPDVLSEIVGSEYIPFGNMSIIGDFLGRESPKRSLTAICHADTGWYLEYKNSLSQCYGWINEEMETTESVVMLGSVLAAMFECGYMDLGILLAGGNVIALTNVEFGGENVYTNLDDYEDVLAELVLGLT